MDEGAEAAGITVQTCTGDAARSLAPVVCSLYQAVFSLPPFSGDEAAMRSTAATQAAHVCLVHCAGSVI